MSVEPVVGIVRSRLFALSLVFLLTACALFASPEVIPPPPEGLRAVPIKFERIEVRLDRGKTIGGYDFLPFCKPPWSDVTWQHGRRSLERVPFADHFHGMLTPRGFDVTGDPTRLFGRKEDQARAELLVAAQIDEITLGLCRHPSIWKGLLQDSGAVGDALIRIHWAVWDVRRQKEVLTFTNNGKGEVDVELPDAAEVAVERAFRDAAAKFAAVEDFRKLAFTSLPPEPFSVPPGIRRSPPAFPSPPSLFDQPETHTEVSIEGLSSAGVQQIATRDEGAREGQPPDAPGALVQVGENGPRGVMVRDGTGGKWVLTFSPLISGGGPWEIIPAIGSRRLAHRDSGTGTGLARLRLEGGAAELGAAALPLARTLPAVGETAWLIGLASHPQAALVAARESGRLRLDLAALPKPGAPVLDRTGAVLGLATGVSGEDGLAEVLVAPASVP